MDKKIERKKRYMIILASFFIMGAGLFLGINSWVLFSTKSEIEDNVFSVEPAQAALLLGAKVYPENRVSHIVYDRILTATELYKERKVEKILISGDHGRVDYDEVNTIKNWLLEGGIPEEDIFMDHAGFSTYESLYRADEIFQVESVILVTQRFHLPRAIFLANERGIRAQGVVADKRAYLGSKRNSVRESLARVKDFFYAMLLKPDPTYLGEKIPITGDGRATAG